MTGSGSGSMPGGYVSPGPSGAGGHPGQSYRNQYQQQQQLLLPQQHPFAVTDDVFMFSDLDHAFMTSSVPTYEEIMQACMPQPPYAAPAPMFPPPTLGFHPSASSGFAAPGQQQFEQSAFYGRAPTPMGTDGAFDAAQAGAFWESLQWAPGP